MTRRTRRPKAKDAPSSIHEVFENVARRAPEMKGPPYDRMIDGRPLSAGEKENLFGLLGPGNDEETRCAAAYIIGKLGIASEAGTLFKSAYLNSEEGSNLRYVLMLAEQCSNIMAELGTAPPKADQLEMLAEMGRSPVDAERRFAALVLEKADIKQGTVTSW